MSTHTKQHIALCGNPNVGKSELFNALTGQNQRTGNWPGVTVECKTGTCKLDTSTATIIDLPGLYTLTRHSKDTPLDTEIANRYLLEEEPDLLINIIDASQLQRQLVLTAQLLEKGTPMVLAINMMDTAKKAGICIDFEALSKQVGCPVVGLIAKKRQGISALKTAIEYALKTKKSPTKLNQWPAALSNALETHRATQTSSTFVFLRACLADYCAEASLNKAEKKLASSALTDQEKKDTGLLSNRIYHQTAQRLSYLAHHQKKKKSSSLSEKIDRIVLNRYLGMPIFFAVIYLMFVFSINIGGAFQDFFDITSHALFVSGSSTILHILNAPPWLISIFSNGIGTGISTVMSFIPVIAAMFVFLALLEDSGYLSRAAFVVDRVMQKLGLPGQSFVPMIVGFGCNVPAVMSARTLPTPRDRILTVLMTPFISCGARLAIFAVFASAFFPKGGQNIIFALYIIGLLAAIGTGFLMRKTVLKGKPSPLIMQLPTYHMPTLRGITRLAASRLKAFLLRAGRIIIPVCVIIGSLNAITLPGTDNNQSNSLLAIAGKSITPILHPMGIHQDNWPATVGLLTGVLAKEVVVGTLNTLYSSHTNTINHTSFFSNIKAALSSIPTNLAGLRGAFSNPLVASEAPHEMSKTALIAMVAHFASPLAAFCYLLFVLLYFPCISTLAAMKREIPKAWAYFSMIWTTGLAYGLATLVYQLGTITEHRIQSLLTLLIVITAITATTLLLRYLAKTSFFQITAQPASSSCQSACTGCSQGCKDEKTLFKKALSQE